jgi:hypothetical protein
VSSVGNPEVDDDELEDESPGLWGSFFTALRLIVGWFCVAIGVVNLLVEVDRVDGGPDTGYLVFHAMLVAGGFVLLGVNSLGRSAGAPGYAAGALVAAAGMAVSAVTVTASACCLRAFDVRHGWPFAVVARNDAAGEAGRWHVDSQHLLADLLFWGYTGLLVLVLVALMRRATGRQPAPGHTIAAGTGHAEQRAYIEHGQMDQPADPPVRERADGA